MKKKVGVIDVGSNSLRLLIARSLEDKLRVIRRELVETRLGEGLSPGKELHPLARKRTLEAFSDFQKILLAERVEDALVVSTSAVREARDGDSFLTEMAKSSPFPVQLLSPEEEAYWSFKGALQGLKMFFLAAGSGEGKAGAVSRRAAFSKIEVDPLNMEQWIVLDLGGRSTELAWLEKEKFMYQSFPFGAVRLHEKFNASLSNFTRRAAEDSREAPAQIKVQVKEYLKEMMSCVNTFRPFWQERELVAVGGTVTTLAAVAQQLQVYSPEAVHGYVLGKVEVERWEKIFYSSSLAEKRALLPFAPLRADIIAAGTSSLVAVMDFLGKEQLLVSEEGLLLGLLEKLS